MMIFVRNKILGVYWVKKNKSRKVARELLNITIVTEMLTTVTTKVKP